ncbi:MAG TPA: phenylalanine--tRNA ligase subunit beta [Planctomycetes bacterium]|nr:phenylalanine--tRNA ligase subunit beta [Planctomycetota bacterium]
MKVSLDWLSDYVDIDKSPDEIAQILSDLGFPTEGIERVNGDTVIDIEVSSNRGDCLSHIGVARELAAATGKELRLPDVDLSESDNEVAQFVDVKIEKPDICGRYTARVITGVKVGPSPDWMLKRLEAVGVRSVNNIVDATNYAMMETGQPPHAFDYDKLGGGKISVRTATAGEQIISIDQTKCDLNTDMLIISDAEKPVAVAGVMGGLESEINDSTTTILLEDAHFDPVTVRTTSRRLGISSESSFRFERHVDKEMIDWASKRTARLITQVAGGKVAKGVADAYPDKWQTQTVTMRVSRLNKLLGIDIAKDEAVKILAGLGFEPKLRDADSIECTTPTWRHDVYREADLIEEVARSYGYDRIRVERKINIEVAPVDKHESVASKLRSFLNGCGFYETINVSFLAEDAAALFFEGSQAEHLTVKDESARSANLLRQTLLPSLLGVLKSNYNAGNIPCSIFELANTFNIPPGHKKGSLPIERSKLALVSDGDFRRLRGVLEGIIGTISKDTDIKLIPVELPWTKAGAEITADNRDIGICGIISDKVADKFDLTDIQACCAELDFNTLLDMSGKERLAKPVPRFPAIRRDLSLIVDEKITWAHIAGAIDKKAPGELEDIQFAGIYRGSPIEAGKKSVTVSLRFRDENGTLKHEIVDDFEKRILDELTTSLPAEVRTV